MSGKQLKNFPGAAAITSTDLIYMSQGGVEVAATPAQLAAGISQNAAREIFLAGTDFTAGSTTTLTLAGTYGSINNILVLCDASVQTDCSLSGQSLTFNPTIPLGTQQVTVIGWPSRSIGVPANTSVGDAQISWVGILNRVVDSVSALSSLNVTLYTRAFATGYYAAGDGGGGAYAYSSTSTAPVNGGTVLAAAGGIGRWLLQTSAPVSIKQFGATGNFNISSLSGTDDYAALNSAINANVPLYVPAGNYRCSHALTATPAADIVICGDGSNTARLIFDSTATSGLTINSSNASSYYGSNPRIVIKGISLLTQGINNGTALSINGNTANEPGVTTEDIFISGLNAGTQYWTAGLIQSHVVGSRHTNIWINGKAGSPNEMTYGVQLAQSSGEGAMVHFFDNLVVKWANFGVYVNSTGTPLGIEGLVFKAPLVIGVNVGIYCNNDSAPSYRPPYVAISDGQFDTGSSGGAENGAAQALWFVGYAQIFISNSVFYGDQSETGTPPELVRFNNCADVFVDDCFFVDFAPSNVRAGIFCDGGTFRVRVNNCHFENLKQGVSIDSSCSNVWLGEFLDFVNCTTNVIDASAVSLRQPKIQRGQFTAGTSGTSVTFPHAFASAPVVMLTPNGTGTNISVNKTNVTASGFTGYSSIAGGTLIDYVAFGD